MTIYLFILLGAIGGALISLSTLAFLLYIAKERIVSKLTARLKKELQSNPGQSMSIVDETLDHLISSLKSQIPMGSMLLTGSLQERIKGKLRGELGTILPDLLPKLILQAKEGLQNEMSKQLKKSIASLIGIGAALGSLLGIVFFMLDR